MAEREIMGEIYKCRDCGNPTGNKHIIAMTRGSDIDVGGVCVGVPPP